MTLLQVLSIPARAQPYSSDEAPRFRSIDADGLATAALVASHRFGVPINVEVAPHVTPGFDVVANGADPPRWYYHGPRVAVEYEAGETALAVVDRIVDAWNRTPGNPTRYAWRPTHGSIDVYPTATLEGGEWRPWISPLDTRVEIDGSVGGPTQLLHRVLASANVAGFDLREVVPGSPIAFNEGWVPNAENAEEVRVPPVDLGQTSGTVREFLDALLLVSEGPICWRVSYGELGDVRPRVIFPMTSLWAEIDGNRTPLFPPPQPDSEMDYLDPAQCPDVEIVDHRVTCGPNPETRSPPALEHQAGPAGNARPR